MIAKPYPLPTPLMRKPHEASLSSPPPPHMTLTHMVGMRWEHPPTLLSGGRAQAVPIAELRCDTKRTIHARRVGIPPSVGGAGTSYSYKERVCVGMMHGGA